MGEDCLRNPGGMALFLGLSEEEVEEVASSIEGLWPANYNSPGQLIVSGTEAGLAAGEIAALARGAKKMIRLDVQGAFHSPLMRVAGEGLRELIRNLPIGEGAIPLFMNATGGRAADPAEVRENLLLQVTSPVKWRQAIERTGEKKFLEIGPGKTLAGMNKKINGATQTISIGKVEDLKQIEVLCNC